LSWLPTISSSPGGPDTPAARYSGLHISRSRYRQAARQAGGADTIGQHLLAQVEGGGIPSMLGLVARITSLILPVFTRSNKAGSSGRLG